MRALVIALLTCACASGGGEPARAPQSTSSAARPRSGPVTNAAAVAKRMNPKFRECYQIGLWQNADQKGSVRLVIDIDAKGRAEQVTPSGGDGLDRMVLTCLVSVVRRESFSGGPVTITIPLRFGSDRGSDSAVE